MNSNIRVVTNSMTPLCQLAIRYGTDKGPQGNYHAYTQRYHEILGEHRNDVRSVLELGVLGGASLRMWRDYFMLAQIIGVDVDQQHVMGMSGESRIQTLLGDEKDPLLLRKLIDLGPYDIVVDDASHDFNDYMTAFEVLVKTTRLYYIIEDVPAFSWDTVICATKQSCSRAEVQISKTDSMRGAVILSVIQVGKENIA